MNRNDTDDRGSFAHVDLSDPAPFPAQLSSRGNCPECGSTNVDHEITHVPAKLAKGKLADSSATHEAQCCTCGFYYSFGVLTAKRTVSMLHVRSGYSNGERVRNGWPLLGQ